MQKKHLTVRDWRHLRLLAPVLAVVCALVVALPAFAYTATTSSVATTLAGSVSAAGPAQLRPERLYLQPQHAAEPDPGDG